MRERSNGVDARGGARFGADMRDDFGFGRRARRRDDARRSTRAHRVSLGVSPRVGIDARAVQNARFTRSSRSRATRRRRRRRRRPPRRLSRFFQKTSRVARSDLSRRHLRPRTRIHRRRGRRLRRRPRIHRRRRRLGRSRPARVRRVIRRRRLRPTTEDVRHLLPSHHRSKALFAVSRENLLFRSVSETRLARTRARVRAGVPESSRDAGSNARVSASLLPTIPSGVMTNENETRRLLGLGLERAHARDEVAALGGYGFMIFANVLADDVKAPGRGEGEADGEAGHARGEHAPVPPVC